MKSNFLVLLIIGMTFYSCNKIKLDLPEDNGCIERTIISVNAHSISPADVAESNTLFVTNNIDNSAYRYYQYLHDSVQTYFPPFAKFDSKVVKVDQYTNGLRIFTGQLVFAFKNEIFSYRGGYPTGGTNLNASPKLTLAQLRKLFIDHIEKFDHKGSQYKDSCFKAEFGYYDLNVGTSYNPEKLTKAWKVTRKNSIAPSEYPIAYYQDDNGKLIYYHNGIEYSRE